MDAVDLVTAIRRVARGESLLDPTVTSKVLHRLRHPSEEDERLAKLTPQERQSLAQQLLQREDNIRGLRGPKSTGE